MDKITRVRVVSAVSLNKRQLSALTGVLSQQMGKPVEIIAQTDASIIGGLLIYTDGHIIDRTVRRQLADMSETILRNQT